jgi:hypothetical protein
MPEPITIAMASFAAVKAGVSGAKSIAELGKDLGTLWQAIDDVKANAKDAKKSGGGNAMQQFIQLKQAEDLEHNLRNIVLSTRGEAGWRQLQELRRKEKQREVQGRYQATKRKNQIANALGIICAMLITGVGAYFMIMFAMKYQ